MSTQIPITPKELRSIRKVLRNDKEVVCLDETAYLKTLLVARDLLMRGVMVNAKITQAGAVEARRNGQK